MELTFIQEYVNKMKNLQELIIQFLDNENSDDSELHKLINFFNDNHYHEDKHELKILLGLIANISNYHYRCHNFWEKIDQILNIFKNEIISYYSKQEIINVFKSSNRVLLFLFKEKILTFDDLSSYKKLFADDYNNELRFLAYFMKEAESFSSEMYIAELRESFEKEFGHYDPEYFEEKRQIGENDSLICELIRKDSIDEFIVELNRSTLSYSSKVPISIFETNSFLLQNEVTLIEYAAFFGSIKIFKYLMMNDAWLEPCIWVYAIHGRNPEIIHILEENVSSDDLNNINNFFENIYVFSLECYHTEIMNYVKENLCQFDKINSFRYEASIKFYNYADFDDQELPNIFAQDNETCSKIFSYLCKYNYYNFVDMILKNTNIDVNHILI